MKKTRILIISILTLTACKEPVNQNLLQGKVEREDIAVTGKVPGRLENIWINEGDRVKRGDTLAILNIPEVEAKKYQALGALESAEAQYNMSLTGATANQLAQLNAKKRALSEQYEFAKKSVSRLKNMLKDSLIPQQKYDETYAKFEGAKAQLDAVKAEIADVKNGVRTEKQSMARGQKKRAMGALQEVNAAESERYIIAPSDMTIETITLKVGELALPGYTLFKGPMPKTTYFRFTIPESRLNQVKKNMPVSVHSVYADKNIKAKIINIRKLPFYADITTAYPDYEIAESLFEIKIIPINSDDVEDLITNTTVTLKL